MFVRSRPRREEIEAAFERGRLAGRRDLLPFRGVPPLGIWTRGVAFEFERNWLDSYISYERRLLDTLRDVQRSLWVARHERDRRTDDRGAKEEGEALEALCELIHEELQLAGSVVDGELDLRPHRRPVVDGLRVAPARPSEVIEYRDTEAFVGEDRRRGPVVDGEAHGNGWRLENPLRRWDTTTWWIVWLCFGDPEPTFEICAIEKLGRDAGDGRIWLLGRIEHSDTVRDTLDDLALNAQRERNSLVVAARAVRRAAGRSS